VAPDANMEVGAAVATSAHGFGTATRFEPRALSEDLGRIYTAYTSRVYFLCLNLTRNCDEAEDLTQETYLRSLQKIAAVRAAKGQRCHNP